MKYDPSDGKWYDGGSGTLVVWGIDDTGANVSEFPTNPNMPIQYWYYSSDAFKFQFDNPYYVAPSYIYLAFYGETDSAGNAPTFHENELTLGTPLHDLSEIKYGVNDTGITFYESKAWGYSGTRSNYTTIMNGIKSLIHPNDSNKLHYSNVPNTNAIFWYMDIGAGVVADVNGGTFWTYNDSTNSFTLGKLYGTNTDPATLGDDASLIENYEFVCDLNRQTAIE